jgi:hypothetical protein
MEVAIFTDTYDSINKIEKQINLWLEGVPGIEIVHVLQSESQGDMAAGHFTLTIFFRRPNVCETTSGEGKL